MYQHLKMKKKKLKKKILGTIGCLGLVPMDFLMGKKLINQAT
ncbi:hypothetical protein WPG_1171 [Winogradskyella sp. PG-2]|nr:hypothetical protein WPG_1171 [Winogradskyella sp. PG-2]